MVPHQASRDLGDLLSSAGVGAGWRSESGFGLTDCSLQADADGHRDRPPD